MKAVFLLFATLCLASHILAQGSIGGYGQGGQGGGMGGGAGGASFGGDSGENNGRFAPGKRKSDESERQTNTFENVRWNSQTMIATAGIGCDWKFDGKAGEVLVAEAVSEVFDASIKVMDEKGKVLAQNDDRYEGNQSPLVIYRFPKDRTVKVNVGSFKNASGGKFEFHNILYKSYSVETGDKEIELGDVEALRREGASTALFHMKAQKGKIYTIGKMNFLGKDSYRSWLAPSGRRFFGPSGVRSNDFEIIENNSGGDYKTFRALSDGQFYIEFPLSDWFQKARPSFNVVDVVTRQTMGKTKYELAPGRQLVVKFPVDPSQVLRTAVSAVPPGISRLDGPPIPKESQRVAYGGSGDESWGSTETFAHFVLKQNSQDAVRIFYAKGDATLVLTNPAEKPSTFTVESDDPITPFLPNTPIEANLGIGDSALYKYESAKNEMMRLRCEGSAFRLRVEIINYRGQLMNSFVDLQANKPGDDLFFANAEKYLFRVTCVGNGGSGVYKLQREPINTMSLALAEKKQIRLDGKSFGIYELPLEGGKSYTISSEFAFGEAGFMMMSEDGNSIQPSFHQFGNLRMYIYQIKNSGKYRIWVRGGGNANVTFKIAPYKPPTIDD